MNIYHEEAMELQAETPAGYNRRIAPEIKEMNV